MPTAALNRNEALKRAALAALVEAADGLPDIGPLLADAGAFYLELRAIPNDLPAEARDLVRKMAGDFRAFLAGEAPRAAGETLNVAFPEALAVLAEHGLSAEELVSEAGLKETVAARRTLEFVEGHASERSPAIFEGR